MLRFHALGIIRALDSGSPVQQASVLPARCRMLLLGMIAALGWCLPLSGQHVSGANAQVSVKTAPVPAADASTGDLAALKVPTVDTKAGQPAVPGSRKIAFTQTPLSFEPALGQSIPAARFLARSARYTLQLEASRARLQFIAPGDPAAGSGAEGRALAMELVDTNGHATITGEEQLPGRANYFPTADPKTWRSKIPTYSRVKYSAVYPGIDLAFYGNANRLEYDFMLKPQADPGGIRMRLAGADQPSVDKNGNLVMRVGKQDIQFLSPVAYQFSREGKREIVSVSYRLQKVADGAPPLVSFALGKYDRGRPLVIDPVLLRALSYAQSEVARFV